jgi:hypothetical protein
VGIADPSFLTGHALVLLCIATWGVRLRDIAASTSVTERTVTASSPVSPRPGTAPDHYRTRRACCTEPG